MERLETRLTICMVLFLAGAFLYIKHLTASLHMNGEGYDMVGFMTYPDEKETLYIPVYRRK